MHFCYFLLFPRLVKPSPVKKSKLSDEATKPIGESLAQKLSSKVKKEEETIKKKDSEEMKREEKSIKVEMKKHCDIKKEDSRSPKKKTDEKKEKSKTAKPSPVKIKVEEKVEVKTAIDVAKASPKKVESSQSSQSQPSSVVRSLFGRINKSPYAYHYSGYEFFYV